MILKEGMHMDFETLILRIIIGILLTAVAYLAFPLIKLLINGGSFSKNRAHKIALWNSIVVGAIFCIVTIEVSDGATAWNAAPAFLYYYINKAILTNKNDAESIEPSSDCPTAYESTENQLQPSVTVQPKIKFCRKCGTKLFENSAFCHKCGSKIAPDSF